MLGGQFFNGLESAVNADLSVLSQPHLNVSMKQGYQILWRGLSDTKYGKTIFDVCHSLQTP